MTEKTSQAGMALDEFIRRYDKERPFEIWKGERVQLMPDVTEQALALANLQRAFNAQAKQVIVKLPYVRLSEAGQVEQALVPHIMFISAWRFEHYTQTTEDWLQKPLVIVPDFAVSIIAPIDTFGHVDRKAALYIQDGVKLAWIVNPVGKNVYVYTPDTRTITVRQGDDLLTGGDVLPDFSVRVSALFAG